MCTLTIVPRKTGATDTPGMRIVCNRDESVLRPIARPPELRSAGVRKLLMPVDPVSEGTWIAASDAPLVGILMNVYVAQAAPPDDIVPLDRSVVSRGTICPRILSDAANISQAVKLADRLDVTQFEPFRLILVDEHRYAEIVWSAGQYSVSKPVKVDEPLFFTSSGLGDDIVATPRRKLFDELFAPDQDWPAAQETFHRFVWPGRDFASVWMTRPEARTQSITWVEIGSQQLEMRYGARNGTTNELTMSPSHRLSIEPEEMSAS